MAKLFCFYFCAVSDTLHDFLTADFSLDVQPSVKAS